MTVRIDLKQKKYIFYKGKSILSQADATMEIYTSLAIHLGIGIVYFKYSCEKRKTRRKMEKCSVQ
jgi:hypothetical protein